MVLYYLFLKHYILAVEINGNMIEGLKDCGLNDRKSKEIFCDLYQKCVKMDMI